MRRFVRPAAVLSGLALVVLASSAGAAPAGPNTLTFADPKGDQLATAAYDITSVTLTTRGKTKASRVKGKKVSAYTPEALVVSMTLAEPPSDIPGALYEIDAQTSGCGGLFLYYTVDGAGSGGFVSCGSEPDATGNNSTTFDVVPTLKGSTITWDVPISSIPREMRPGTKITEIEAYSTQVDPLTGVVGPYLLTHGADYDYAVGSGSYTIG